MKLWKLLTFIIRRTLLSIAAFNYTASFVTKPIEVLAWATFLALTFTFFMLLNRYVENRNTQNLVVLKLSTNHKMNMTPPLTHSEATVMDPFLTEIDMNRKI